MKGFHIIFFVLIAAVLGSGCSYQKLLKNGTPDERLTAAKKYYNKGDYNRALPLLDGLLGTMRKKGEAEEIYYYFSYTHYGMGDFTMAAYNFKNFTENYPRSEYTEEAAFMAAKCSYHKSLPYYLDPTNTKKAIESIQLFINKYPGSSYVADGNQLIDELRSKLHQKAYSNAKLYYKMGNYKSSYVAFKNAIADYPDLPQMEELEFLVVKSSYLYAKQSFQSIQSERYQVTVDDGALFLLEEHEDKSYIKEVEEMVTEAKNKILKLKDLEVTK